MTAKQSIAWLQAAWKDDKKRINLLLVSGLAGMLLLCMSEWLPAGQSTQNAAQSSQQSQTAAEYEQQLETRLAALIRAMDGAGETVDFDSVEMVDGHLDVVDGVAHVELQLAGRQRVPHIDEVFDDPVLHAS